MRSCDALFGAGRDRLYNMLIDHSGEMIEDVGWFWDHADKQHLIAHDYLIANYVYTSREHYPLEFRHFCKREDAFYRDGKQHPRR